jgi:hypothetical protein
MLTFDQSSKEVCLSRRIRTNTPLQALTLLNDSTMLVASRQLAIAMTGHDEKGIKTAIAGTYELMMGRPADPKKVEVLTNLYAKAVSTYRKDPVQGLAISGPLGPGLDKASAAASVVVANAMLNLDEFITKN